MITDLAEAMLAKTTHKYATLKDIPYVVILHVGSLDGSVQGVQNGPSDRTSTCVNTGTHPCLYLLIITLSLMPNPKISSKHQKINQMSLDLESNKSISSC